MTLTLRAIADTARLLTETYFVMQRDNGHWSPAARVLHVYDNQDEAEAAAMTLKREHPQQNYGIAKLCAEAREVAKPIEIIRTGDI